MNHSCPYSISLIDLYLIFIGGNGVFGFFNMFRQTLFALSAEGVPPIIPRADRYYGFVWGHVDTSRITVTNILITVQFLIGDFFTWQSTSFISALFTIFPLILRFFFVGPNQAVMNEDNESNTFKLSLVKAMDLHRKLVSISDDLNTTLSLPYFVFILFSILQACTTLPTSLVIGSGKSSSNLLGNGTDMQTLKALNPFYIFLLATTALSIFMAASVNHQARRALEWFEAERHKDSLSSLGGNDFSSFMNRIAFNEIGFNGMGFFVVTKSFVVTVSRSAILTYVIVIAQFSNK